MGQDATTTVLKSSVLGTVRVFIVLLAGFLASKWPRKERESTLINYYCCTYSSTILQLLLLYHILLCTQLLLYYR